MCHFIRAATWGRESKKWKSLIISSVQCHTRWKWLLTFLHVSYIHTSLLRDVIRTRIWLKHQLPVTLKWDLLLTEGDPEYLHPLKVSSSLMPFLMIQLVIMMTNLSKSKRDLLLKQLCLFLGHQWSHITAVIDLCRISFFFLISIP